MEATKSKNYLGMEERYKADYPTEKAKVQELNLKKVDIRPLGFSISK